MPWQLDEFVRERLEKGRRLLAESEDFRGSTDLQVGRRCAWHTSGQLPQPTLPAAKGMCIGRATLPVLTHNWLCCTLQLFLEYMDSVEQLQQLWMEAPHVPRQGLSARQKEQVRPGQQRCVHAE